MTNLELASIRLYKATLTDKERTLKMRGFICEREGDPNQGKQNRPCWKTIWEPSQFDEYGRTELVGYWDYPNGTDDEGDVDITTWCQSCQDRQKIYLDRSVRKELGNAKRSFWVVVRGLIKDNNIAQMIVNNR